jgi:hypothetical protein
MSVKKLNLMEFWELVGSNEFSLLCERCGTTFANGVHMAHGRRNPSKKLAFKFASLEPRLSLKRMLFTDVEAALL